MISGWDGRKTRFRFRGFGGGRGGGEERVDGERWVGILFENDSSERVLKGGSRKLVEDDDGFMNFFLFFFLPRRHCGGPPPPSVKSIERSIIVIFERLSEIVKWIGSSRKRIRIGRRERARSRS